MARNQLNAEEHGARSVVVAFTNEGVVRDDMASRLRRCSGWFR